MPTIPTSRRNVSGTGAPALPMLVTSTEANDPAAETSPLYPGVERLAMLLATSSCCRRFETSPDAAV